MDDGDCRASRSVVLTLPADPAYVAVARSAAAGIASMLDWTVDDLDDLRIAVDEASTMLLRLCADGGLRLDCDQQVDGGLSMRLSAETGGKPVATNGFGWTVLAALGDSVETSVRDGTTVIMVRKSGNAHRDGGS